MNSATSTHSISVADFERTLSLISTEGLPLLVLGRKATKFTDIPHALSLAQAAVNADTDVYFSLATVTGNAHETYGHTLRNSANLVSYGALFAELDAGEGKPFPDQDSAKSHLQSICATGLPKPTHIVSSGGGLHLYWKLDAPLAADEFATILPIWKATLQRFGLQFDAAALLPTQILRVAGTFNFKHGQVRPVEFLDVADGAYNYISLAQWMQAVCPDVPRAIPMADREAPAQAGRFEIDWLREELSKLEPDCTREAWLAVGFGLAGETACSDEGYALWNDWSMGALTGMPVPSYSEEACWKFWSSAQDSRSTAHAWGPSVTERLFARQGTEVTNARAETMARMLATTNVAAQAINLDAPAGLPRPNPLGVAPITVQAAVLPEGLLEDAARGQAAAKRSEAAKERAANTKHEREQREATASASGMPEVLQNICYSDATGEFYNFETGICYADKVFNSSFELPLLQVNCIDHMSPSKQARVLYAVPKYEGDMFRPTGPMIVTEVGIDGVERAFRNTFPLKSRRPLETEVTPEGQAAFDMLKFHVLHGLCGGDEPKARALLSTLIWYLKNPGVRLGTLLYIAGAPGIGKSLLMQMVASCFGSDVVVMLPESDFSEGITFNAHLAGGVIGCVDEITGSGMIHRKVADKFRELVTNPTISIEGKGVNRTNCTLTKNFAIFSNYPDLVWLPDNDRRTLYIHPTWASKEEMLAHMAKEYGLTNYIERLVDALKNHPGQLLLQARMYQMPEGFKVDAEPHMTLEKRQKLDSPPSAQGSAISMVLAQCDDLGSEDPSVYIGISRNIVSSLAVMRALKRVTGEEKITTRGVGHDLSGQFHRLDNITGVNGQTKSAYSYGNEHHTIYYRKGTPRPSFADISQMFKDTKLRVPRPEKAR
jgi:hypothetical protein